ncbi:hypothetical protein BDY17DRAFT_305384 [Neohortaea acidophila]|uniref:Apple domain-containing protein n=1 Tax=Neohortaea acidophila TaxID=245834 RepID=A0A6A6PH54_9PEZI|nr:uncharacterized protein BDY17DRAFT_305384 [Neohortaea acidophila]KAF2479320.1 hypothetical protein BDY17DRAFT_305384 [Neohortaea acidophila]
MHSSISALAFAGMIGSIVSASPLEARGATSKQCYTLLGTRSVGNVPTYVTTISTQCTVTSHFSTSQTVILYPQTGTITITTTPTLSTVSTSTVPVPTSWFAVQDSLSGASYDGTGGSDPIVSKRALDVAAKVTKSYPEQVTCTAYVPSRICSTLRTTSTSTATITPKKIYSTVTSTTTSTTYTSSTTVYAACATNNFVDTVASGPEGPGIGGIALQGGGAFTDDVTAVVNSAYNCCVFGLGVPFAAAVFAWDETTGNCFVAGNSNTCPAGGQNNNFAQVQTQSSVQYVAGNLPCGAITEAD